MKTKRILSLLLVMLIFLASCGDASSNHEEDRADDVPGSGFEQTGNDNPASEQDRHQIAELSDYWEYLVKDASSGGFEQADSESFVFEQDGYVIEITLDKWVAARGSSEYVFHPASDEIPLPLLKPSDCVIPFVLTAKTATDDTAFTTDFQLSAHSLEYKDEYGYMYASSSYRLYGCELSLFESAVELYTENLDNMKLNYDIDDLTSYEGRNLIQEHMSNAYQQAWWQTINNNFSGTKLGDGQIILGCYVINDYYSPKFPDGNLELFPRDSAAMRVQVVINNSWPAEETDVVMH